MVPLISSCEPSQFLFQILSIKWTTVKHHQVHQCILFLETCSAFQHTGRRCRCLTIFFSSQNVLFFSQYVAIRPCNSCYFLYVIFGDTLVLSQFSPPALSFSPTIPISASCFDILMWNSLNRYFIRRHSTQFVEMEYWKESSNKWLTQFSKLVGLKALRRCSTVDTLVTTGCLRKKCEIFSGFLAGHRLKIKDIIALSSPADESKTKHFYVFLSTAPTGVLTAENF